MTLWLKPARRWQHGFPACPSLLSSERVKKRLRLKMGNPCCLKGMPKENQPKDCESDYFGTKLGGQAFVRAVFGAKHPVQPWASVGHGAFRGFRAASADQLREVQSRARATERQKDVTRKIVSSPVPAYQTQPSQPWIRFNHRAKETRSAWDRPDRCLAAR